MIGASVLTLLAVLSKGSAVVLPVVFLILDAYPLGRLGQGRPGLPAIGKLMLEKIPILACCAIFVGVAFSAKQSGLEPAETTQNLLIARMAQASFGACFYIAKTLWPFAITAFYPRPERGDFQTPLFAACFAAVVVAVCAALGLRRRWPWFLAALAAYLVLASPYLGLVRVSIFLAADHYGQAPLMIWVVLGCGGLCGLAQRRWSRPVLVGAGGGMLALASGLMVLSWAQCRVWDSSEHLWGHALQHAQWSSELHRLMGASLANDGKLERAAALEREALRIRPHEFEATCQLGSVLQRRGETAEAITLLREAQKMRPKDARVHLNLGAALVQEGRLDEAIALYREAVELEPTYPSLRFNLGVALLKQKRIDGAIIQFTRAVELRPWYTEAHATLGSALVLRGRLDEAIAHYQEALRLDPNHSSSRINLAMCLARQRHSAEAIAELRETIERDPRNPEAHHVLGAILLGVGQKDAAAAEFEEALRLQPDHAQARAFLAMVKRERK
jgi:tetratricopeptide (TPR) repeat protein